MNRRIAVAVAVAGSLLTGPATLAAAQEPVPAPAYDLEAVGDGIFDHPQDDHDHDGDGKQDHDPEDHDDDDDEKSDGDHE